MSQEKRLFNNISRISLLIGSAVFLHLMLTPLAYTTNLELASGKQNAPFALSKDAYIINEVNNYKIINNIKINSILSKYLRNFERLLKRILDATIQPAITIDILLIYTVTIFKITRRRKSLLAFSLGGHAPPLH